MKIVADRAIPFLAGVLEPWAEVLYRDGASIDADDLRDADVLLTRTRTRCDARLLAESPLRLIASATIGLDHVDLAYCRSRGIRVENAAGCNAQGVANYVLAAIAACLDWRERAFSDCCIGVVGVGQVGSRVVTMARRLGFRVLLNDPPRADREGKSAFCDLDLLLSQADIVTLHVPLNAETRGMVDGNFLARMQPGAMWINASRGEVVCEEALLAARPALGPVVIDTWCHEPEIDSRVLAAATLATPHIAGYSLQGKMNGTAAVVRAIAREMRIPELLDFYPPGAVAADEIAAAGKNSACLAAQICEKYPIFADDAMLRAQPEAFELLRKGYRYRNEFQIH